MNVLIIEDEEAAARRLRKLVTEMPRNHMVLGTLDSIEAALAWFDSNSMPDLLLLDIQLADGSSFEIFGHISITCPVIFVTAFDEYAVKAFRVNAIDYLMKPIKKVELQQAFERVENTHAGQFPDDLLKKLGDSGLVQKPSRVLVRIGQSIKLVDLDQASYFYTQDKITFAVLPEGKRYPIEHSLEQLDQQLNSSKFFRINRQFIIGLDSIEEMHSYSKSRVKIDLTPAAPTEVIVSTDRSPHFKKWLTGEL